MVNHRRDEVLEALGLVEPWRSGNEPLLEEDLQGWNSEHPYLLEAIDERTAPIVVEVGVWKGASTIAMAQRLRQRGAGGVVIAVDTFLGSAEHYLNPEWKASLRLRGAEPHLFDTFVANVRAAGLQDYIVPLVLDSVNASVLVGKAAVRVDVVHIDAGHDFDSVSQDVRRWFDLLSPGGIVVCDDYADPWPGVVAAVDAFTMSRQVEQFEAQGGKCRFTRPMRDATDGSAAPTGADARLVSDALLQRHRAVQRAAELEQELDALHTSRSWRWTKWARSLLG